MIDWFSFWLGVISGIIGLIILVILFLWSMPIDEEHNYKNK